MSLLKPTKQNSIDGGCLSPSICEVTQDTPPLEMSPAVLSQGHLLTSWRGEASPTSTSSACSTPLKRENQSEDLGLEFLAITGGEESAKVPQTDIRRGQDAHYPETWARMGITDRFSQSDPDEDDDDDSEWYQPKGGLSVPTSPKPTKPINATAVGKPGNPGSKK